MLKPALGKPLKVLRGAVVNFAQDAQAGSGELLRVPRVAQDAQVTQASRLSRG
jgi:hypothetical protein